MQLPERIRILLVTSNLDSGGVEELIRTLVAGIDPSGFEMAVAFLRTGAIARELAAMPGVRCYHVATRSRVARFFRFWQIARAFRPHIVHNHACWYGLLAGFLAGARRVETIHNSYDWFRFHERVHYGLYCMLADRLIAVCRSVRDFTVHSIPFVRTNSLSVIYNGVQTGRFIPRPDAASLRLDAGIGPREIVIGFIGRLTEQKGVSYLLSALIPLSTTGIPVRCIIVGTGDLESALREQARTITGVTVSFYGFRRDIPGCLALFDIFVLPSLWEGFPMGLLEGMAAERPVVATSVGGTPEAVVDGENGFLVEPRNVRQLAGRLRTLAVDLELRQRLGTAGRRTVETLFSAEKMVRSTEELYRELAERR